MIVLIIVLYSFQGLFSRLYAENYPGGANLASQVFCLTECLVIFLVAFAFNGFQIHLSKETVLIGALNALMLFGYNVSLLQATTRGSYAFQNMAVLFGGIVLPMLYSTIFLKEALPLIKYGAVVLMLVSFVMMNLKGLDLKGSGALYYLFCALLFFCNGIFSVLIKVQSVYNPAENREMIMLTYLLMGIPALIQTMITKKKTHAKLFRFDRKSLVFFVLLLSVASIAVNLLVLIMPKVNVVVFYTVENGGVLLLAALYSVIIFKEKMDWAKVVGILMAVVSMTVMSMTLS